MFNSGYMLRFPHLSKVASPFIFLFGPLFYFYARTLTEPNFHFQKKDILHALPWLLCVLYFTPYYFSSTAEKIAHIKTDQVGVCFHCSVLIWLDCLQILVYMILVGKIIFTEQARNGNSRSAITDSSVRWLRYLLGSVFLIWLASLILQFISPTIQAENIIWLMVSCGIYVTGYMVIRRPEVFANPATKKQTLIFGNHKKYERSTLTEERANEYVQRLHDLMSHEKPHLSNDISLRRLARQLSMSSHHLSQIINDKLNQNFFEFINSHRIKDAKTRISAPENKHKTLAEIGFDVGFNSISSFNTAFKKHAGMTPSEFRTREIAS